MASVLEGFLVRLGFDVDKDGQKRFDADVDAASERIKGMAKHAVAAGTAIGAAFLKASSDVNSLYNATNFTGSSIRGFTALQKAVERVGGSGASVSAAFQSLAQNVMTLGPGFEELLDHQLGVSLTDSVGKLRDMSDVFMDIRNKLAEINKVDPIQARQLASVVGLGDAFDAVMKKDFPAELERTRSLMGGFAEDVDKSADSTHRLMNELGNTWGVITGAIQSGAAQITDALDLDQKLKDFNDGFSIWMRDTVKAEVQMVEDSDGVLDWAQKWLFDADDYQSAATYKRLGEKIASGKATDDEKAQYEEFGKDDDVVEIASGKLEAQKEPQAVAPAAAPDQDGSAPIDRPVTIERPEPIEVPAQSVHVEPAANIEMPEPIEVPAQSVHVEPAANIEMPEPIEVPAQSVHVEPAANIEMPEPIEVPAQSVHVEPAANIEMPEPIEVPAQSVHVEPAANIEMPEPIEVPAQSVHVEPAANIEMPEPIEVPAQSVHVEPAANIEMPEPIEVPAQSVHVEPAANIEMPEPIEVPAQSVHVEPAANIEMPEPIEVPAQSVHVEPAANIEMPEPIEVPAQSVHVEPAANIEMPEPIEVPAQSVHVEPAANIEMPEPIEVPAQSVHVEPAANIEMPEPIEVPAQSVHVEPAANIEMPEPIEVPAQSVHVEPAANIEMPEPIEVPAQSVHVEPAANIEMPEPIATVTVDDSDSETISTPVRVEAPTPAPARNDRQEPPRVREPVSAPAPDMDIKQSRFADVRGIRNNNPGNLRASRLASGKDDGFSTFATMVDGYRAMAEQLKMYWNAGLDNVASIVTKYAPASENNTSAYIDSVVSSMRKDLGTKELVATTSLDLGDRRVLKSLVDAMIDHENGSGASDYFNGSAYSAAIAAASQTTQKSRTVAGGDKIASTGGIVINQAISVTGQDAVAAAGTIARETKRQIARNSTSNLS